MFMVPGSTNYCMSAYMNCAYTECQFALYENKILNDKSTNITFLVQVPSIQSLVLVNRNNPKKVNASRCQIISLEVLRGLNISIEINRAGFILTNNSIFEVKLHVQLIHCKVNDIESSQL